MASATFRFLDLHKELRLMVYDFLPITVSHVKKGEVKLVTHTLPIQILCVNREINNEAKSIMYGTLNTFRFSVPRIFMKSNAHALVSGKHGILPALFDWLLRLYDNPLVKFEQWKSTPTFTSSSDMLDEGKYPGVALFIKQAGFKLMNIFNAMKTNPHYSSRRMAFVNVAFDSTASEEHQIDEDTGMVNHARGSYWHVEEHVYQEMKKTYRSLRWNVWAKETGLKFVLCFCMNSGPEPVQHYEVEVVGMDWDTEGMLWEQGWDEGKFLM
jgi:tRNA splicing endonuclease